MKKLFFYLLLSSMLHGLLFIPMHFSKQKSYKVAGQKQVLQARLVIAEPKPTQNRLSGQAGERSLDLMTASAKKGVLKKKQKESKKRSNRALKKNYQKPQQKKLSGEQTNQLITIIYQAVHKNKIYPLQSRRLHHQGKVLIAFSLLPTGYIKDVVIKKSSGYIELDKAALKALSASQPFKIEQLLSAKQDIAIPIVYRLAKK